MLLNDALGFCSVCQKWLNDEEFANYPGKCEEHKGIYRIPGETDEELRKRIQEARG